MCKVLSSCIAAHHFVLIICLIICLIGVIYIGCSTFVASVDVFYVRRCRLLYHTLDLLALVHFEAHFALFATMAPYTNSDFKLYQHHFYVVSPDLEGHRSAVNDISI